MKTLIFSDLLVLVGFLMFCSSQAAQESRERPESYRLNPDRFGEVVEAFAENADVLKLNDGLLELKFPGSEETNQLVVKSMGKVSGGGGGGRDSWAYARHDVNCEMMMGKGLRRMGRRWRGMHRYHVEISEKIWPFRLFEMTEHEDRLELFYVDPSRQIAFWLVQLMDGVQLVFIEGPDCQRYSASSFSALAKKHDLKPVVSHESLAAFKLDKLIASIDEADTDEGPSFDDKFSNHLGIYGAARETLSKFVTLSMDGGKIRVDRESWKSYLGADSAQALIQRAEDEFNATGLPKSWLLIGKERDETSRHYYDFPQILFEHYLAKIQQNSRYSRGPDGAPSYLFHSGGRRSRSFNRELDDNSQFNARLQMHPPIYGMEEGKQEYLALTIHDAVARDTRLRLFEKPNESFSLLLRSGNSNRLCWLFQDEDGACWMHHVTLGDAISIKGEAFQDMFQGNSETISGEVFDLFREMGINVGPQIGGPLKLENIGVFGE